MELQAQYATALLMAAAGAALSAVYDVYRTSLREWRFLMRFSALFDMAFWVFAVVFVFTLLLGANDGDVRIVVFVLLAIGAFVYRRTAHALVVASTRMVVRAILWILRFALAVLTAVFVTPVLYALRLAAAALRLLDRALAGLEPLIAWPVLQAGRAGAWAAARLAGQARKYLRPLWLRGKERWARVSNTWGVGWLRRLFSRGEDDGDT